MINDVQLELLDIQHAVYPIGLSAARKKVWYACVGRLCICGGWDGWSSCGRTYLVSIQCRFIEAIEAESEAQLKMLEVISGKSLE
jgi:hypothetical protein